jgi:hypothetical protein
MTSPLPFTIPTKRMLRSSLMIFSQRPRRCMFVDSGGIINRLQLFRYSSSHGMAALDMRRIMQAHQLVDVSVGEILCRISRQNSLTVRAVNLLEGQPVGCRSLRFLCVVFGGMLVVYKSHP